MCDFSLVVTHISIEQDRRNLTSVISLEPVLSQWESCRDYFLKNVTSWPDQAFRNFFFFFTSMGKDYNFYSGIFWIE